jgi:hypothetical protein
MFKMRLRSHQADCTGWPVASVHFPNVWQISMAVWALRDDIYAEEASLVGETPPPFASGGGSWSIIAAGGDTGLALNRFETGTNLLVQDRK